MDASPVDQVLQAAVESGAVPHVAAIVADRDGVTYEGAAGELVVGGGQPVSTSTHFRIMSMTKMVVTAAALQLVERGKLELDASVATYRPEFADVQVLAGWDGDTPLLRAPVSQATVRQLLTHTTGHGYWFWSDEIVRWNAATAAPHLLAGQKVTLRAPLLEDPGTTFRYGINTDWLGQVIEAVTGTALPQAVADGITGPLGMSATTFQPSATIAANVTPVHVKGADGTWAAMPEIDLNPEPEYFAGGHGLYSTPRDYIRFQRALLGGGELEGTRILSAATVDAAFSNQIGELDFPAEIPTFDPASSADFVAGPGWKWGYGLLLNSADVPGMRTAGTGAWAGLCNTHFWVDRTTGVTASIYSNTLPFGAPEPLGLYGEFERAVYAAL